MLVFVDDPNLSPIVDVTTCMPVNFGKIALFSVFVSRTREPEAAMELDFIVVSGVERSDCLSNSFTSRSI